MNIDGSTTSIAANRMSVMTIRVFSLAIVIQLPVFRKYHTPPVEIKFSRQEIHNYIYDNHFIYQLSIWLPVWSPQLAETVPSDIISPVSDIRNGVTVKRMNVMTFIMSVPIL